MGWRTFIAVLLLSEYFSMGIKCLKNNLKILVYTEPYSWTAMMPTVWIFHWLLNIKKTWWYICVNERKCLALFKAYFSAFTVCWTLLAETTCGQSSTWTLKIRVWSCVPLTLISSIWPAIFYHDPPPLRLNEHPQSMHTHTETHTVYLYMQCADINQSAHITAKTLAPIYGLFYTNVSSLIECYKTCSKFSQFLIFYYYFKSDILF